ncbi:MAG: hypothetical protein RL637_1565 [Pseudomonadota bacterium]|jgi:hypothetical protein
MIKPKTSLFAENTLMELQQIAQQLELIQQVIDQSVVDTDLSSSEQKPFAFSTLSQSSSESHS